MIFVHISSNNHVVCFICNLYKQDNDSRSFAKQKFEQLLYKKLAFKVYIKKSEFSMEQYAIVQRMTDHKQTVDKLTYLINVRKDYTSLFLFYKR